MVNPKVFIQNLKGFISENPRRAKFIGLLILAIALPLIVVAALTVQNLTQRASESSGVQIVDSNGNSLPSVISEPNVLLKINLPSNWTPPSPSSFNNSIVKNAYAQSSTIPTLSSCVQSGGVCTASYPCNPGYTASSLSCESSEVCCVVAAPTSTPKPKVELGGSCSFGDPCKEGLTCGNYDENGYGVCVVPATPKLGLGESCGNDSQCESLKCGNFDESGNGICVDSTSIPTNTPVPNQPLVASPQTVQTINYILIENSDTDGSSGGYDSIRIASNIKATLGGLIPWKLNDLLPTQTQANRVIKVTLSSTTGNTQVFTANVTLVPRGASTNKITPAAEDSSTALITTPDLQLTLTCQSTSEVKYHVETNGVTKPTNFDIFINGNKNNSFKGNGGNLNFSNTGPNGNYSVTLRDPDTNKLITSAIKEIDCSTFSAKAPSPTPTSVLINSGIVMKFDFSCNKNKTVKYILTATGATQEMIDLWIDGNKIPQSNWKLGSENTGPNGNYAATVRGSTTNVSAPTIDCEVFPFKYDLSDDGKRNQPDGKVNEKDVEFVQKLIQDRIYNAGADFNDDKKIDQFDYNFLLRYINSN